MTVVSAHHHAKEAAELRTGSSTELTAHRTIQQEVDSRIEQGKQIQDFTHAG
jgi:soluble cytochrome b562